MKKDIHPKLHLVKITNADKETFNVLSVNNQDLTINSSRSTHPAWTGKVEVIINNKKAQKIGKFFQDF